MFSRRVRHFLVGVAVVISVFSVVGGTALAETAQPTALATPHTGLKNGATIKVTGSHFVPKSQIFIVQCSKGIVGKSGLAGEPYCGTYNFQSATITKSGTIPTGVTFKVTTGVMGSAKGSSCGTTKTNAVCYIGVGNAAGSNDDSALAKVTFTVPK